MSYGDEAIDTNLLPIEHPAVVVGSSVNLSKCVVPKLASQAFFDRRELKNPEITVAVQT